MTLNEYQTETINYTEKDTCFRDITFCSVALAEEAGEVCGKVKRIQRDHDGEITPEVRTAILAELGDVLFCVMRSAASIGVTGEEVMRRSYEKMQDRKRRGVQHGSGDDR